MNNPIDYRQLIERAQPDTNTYVSVFCAGGDLQFILEGEQAIKSGADGATTIWR
jgi:hypothetical protein